MDYYHQFKCQQCKKVQTGTIQTIKSNIIDSDMDKCCLFNIIDYLNKKKTHDIDMAYNMAGLTFSTNNMKNLVSHYELDISHIFEDMMQICMDLRDVMDILSFSKAFDIIEEFDVSYHDICTLELCLKYVLPECEIDEIIAAHNEIIYNIRTDDYYKPSKESYYYIEVKVILFYIEQYKNRKSELSRIVFEQIEKIK